MEFGSHLNPDEFDALIITMGLWITRRNAAEASIIGSTVIVKCQNHLYSQPNSKYPVIAISILAN